eukprot:3068978-Pleurochrysis_carterae.AAC.5
MLIVLALLGSRPTSALGILPEPRRTLHAWDDVPEPRSTARASSDPRRSHDRLSSHWSVFSLAATDAEHVCFAYASNGYIVSALWICMQTQFLWAMHWALHLLPGSCRFDLYRTHCLRASPCYRLRAPYVTQNGCDSVGCHKAQ